MIITYNTYKFPGKFEKFVTIFTDINNNAEYRVDITGFVKAIPMGVLEVKPRKISLGGGFKTGSVIPVSFEIANTGDFDMEVTRIVLKKKKTILFDAAHSGVIIIKPGKKEKIETTITSDTSGRMLDYAMIHSDARNVTKKGYKVVVVATFE